MARSQMRHTVKDAAGNIIQNALCYVYATGTVTAVTDMYAAASGGSTITTLTSDAQGQIEAWFDAAQTVDIKVTDNTGAAYYPSVAANLLSWSDFTETVQVGDAGTNLASQLVGIEYAGVHEVTAGDGPGIATAIAAATAAGASATARRAVLLPAGTYTVTQRIAAANYVDLIGMTGDPDDVIITSAINANDTATVGGITTLWAYLTVKHTGATVAYGIHADATGAGAVTILVSVIASSESKSGIGIGLRGGESLYCYDCEFIAYGTYSTNKIGCYSHNSAGSQPGPCVMVMVDCVATGATWGFRWDDADNDETDTVFWLGGSISGATNEDVHLNLTGSVWGSNVYLDSRAYVDVDNEAAAFLLGTRGVRVPAPSPMPTRRPYRTSLLSPAKSAAIAAPTAPSAAYVQAEAQSMKTAVDAIRAALTAHGITL